MEAAAWSVESDPEKDAGVAVPSVNPTRFLSSMIGYCFQSIESWAFLGRVMAKLGCDMNVDVVFERPGFSRDPVWAVDPWQFAMAVSPVARGKP